MCVSVTKSLQPRLQLGENWQHHTDRPVKSRKVQDRVSSHKNRRHESGKSATLYTSAVDSSVYSET